MDSDFMPTISQAHPDTMDLLSLAWCNFAVQEALQPESQDQSIVLQDYPIKIIDDEPKNPFLNMDKSVNMDNGEKTIPTIPPWRSNDVKSWIWMQQAMHPELNYNSCFRKKWLPWKIVPMKHISIKKWWKEIKQKRKEEQRLQKAEVHAAISVAGVAAALAALAAENSNHDNSSTATTTKEAAVAAAAALVAAQCAKVAEAMGAKREQLGDVMGSAMSGGTTTSDILTLTAAATTSLRGASTLKTRVCKKSRFSGSVPVLPLEESSDFDFNFEKCRGVLAKGAKLNVETADGRCMVRSVSVILNSEAKVILKIRKLNFMNAFSSKMESIVLDQHTELYKDSEMEENNTCYLIVLTTNRGIVKLDMMDDYKSYKIWKRTIDHILALSTSFTKYELKFYKR